MFEMVWLDNRSSDRLFPNTTRHSVTSEQVLVLAGCRGGERVPWNVQSAVFQPL